MQTGTQKERIAEQLKAIAVDVTEQDRKAFRKAFNLSAATVSYYLNGNSTSSDTGIQMLQFFKERIAAREKVLNN